MNDFLDNIINYLTDCFLSYSELTQTKRPIACESHKVNNEQQMSKPEVQVQIVDAREQTNYTTFCGKKAMNIPLQITAYAGQTKFGGIVQNAQRSSLKLADKIVEYIDKLIYADNNYGIRYARHISSSPALPMNEGGSMYASAVRYDFIVQI